jgi:hypothetical protein
MKRILLLILWMSVACIAQTTPTLNLNVPSPGSNTGTWGSLLNANMYTIEYLLTGATPIPAANIQTLKIGNGLFCKTSIGTFELCFLLDGSNILNIDGDPTQKQVIIKPDATTPTVTISPTVVSVTGNITASGSIGGASISASGNVSASGSVQAGTVNISGSSFAALSDGTTITWALGTNQFANTYVTINGNRTLNITGGVNGGNYALKVFQGSGGSHTLTLGTGCAWKVANGGGGAINLTATAGAADMLVFIFDGTNCNANLIPNLN